MCLLLLFGLLLPAGAWADDLAAAPGSETPAGAVPGGSSEAPAEAGTADAASGLDATAKLKVKLLLGSLTVFAVAIFLGCEVITKVPPTLHTPLMSGSNAISGITLVGSLVAAGSQDSELAAILGMIAVALATINVVGGFLVTHRMLQMFRKK
jgi:NAD(P) transhydrogenase subunit alpha